MNIREINKPVTSKTLNETLARKFGTRIDVDSFTLEQLQDARNKIRTKLSQIETNESFSGLTKNETYSKNKLFLDVLNAAISERELIDEAAIDDYLDKKRSSSSNDDSGRRKHSGSRYGGSKQKDDDDEGPAKKGEKPDFLDLDGDGNKKEPMKGAAKDKKKMKEGENDESRYIEEKAESKNQAVAARIALKHKKEGTKPKAGTASAEMVKMSKSDLEDFTKAKKGAPKKKTSESMIREGEEDKAELVMAAKDMVDRLTGWMEDTAEMQSQSMLELADAIRDELGQAQSDSFVNSVKPALEQLYAAMEGTRQSLTQGVGMLTGEEEPAEDMGAEPEMQEPVPTEDEMEPTIDQDEFGAAAAAAGGEEEAGRARRESKLYAKRAMLESSRRIAAILSKKK